MHVRLCVHVFVCARVCVPAHLAAFHSCQPVCICVFVNKDLEPALSIPGRQSLSIVTFNDLHMGPASAGYINIPVYSNVRVDRFS